MLSLKRFRLVRCILIINLKRTIISQIERKEINLHFWIFEKMKNVLSYRRFIPIFKSFQKKEFYFSLPNWQASSNYKGFTQVTS